MKPPPFAYYRPATLAEANARLRSEEGAVPMSGGQSLVPLLNLRLARPTTVVDLGAIPDLDSITVDGDRIRVGASATHSRLERHDWPAGMGAVPEAVAEIGYSAIRHRGTIGGSLAHADPAAELPTLALALDADVELTSPDGSRTVAADDFFVGYYDTVRSHDELVTAVIIPAPAGLRTGFAEVSRRRGDFALTLAAVSTWIGPSGPQARVAVGGLDVRPRRIPDLEDALAAGGSEWEGMLDPDLLSRHVTPADDIHGSADYRLLLGVEMLRRAFSRLGEAA